MSRGPGTVTRAIVNAIHAQPLSEDGAPVRLAYRELAEQIYKTPTPTVAQRESVGRACRRLQQDNKAVIWRELRKVEQKRITPTAVPCRPMTVYQGAVTRPITDDEWAAMRNHRSALIARGERS
jgi:hypothetical protein